jgi:hypothetical protein
MEDVNYILVKYKLLNVFVYIAFGFIYTLYICFVFGFTFTADQKI